MSIKTPKQTLARSAYYIERKCEFSEIHASCYFEIYESKGQYHLKSVSKSIRPHSNSQTAQNNIDKIYYKQYEQAIKALEFNCDFVNKACELQDISIPNPDDVTPKTVEKFENSFFKNMNDVKRLKENNFVFSVASANGCAIKTGSLVYGTHSIDLQAKFVLEQAKECVKNFIRFNPYILQTQIENFEKEYTALLERKAKAFERADELLEKLQTKEISLFNLQKTLFCQTLYPSVRQALEENTHSL